MTPVAVKVVRTYVNSDLREIPCVSRDDTLDSNHSLEL